MIRGVRTVTYPAPDLATGKAWYNKVLGVEPYFDEPFYVGYAVGPFEVGLIPDAAPSASGAQVLWDVEDAASALAWLNGLGAMTHEGVTDVGGGVRVASVLDPFGNVFGIVESPPASAQHT